MYMESASEMYKDLFIIYSLLSGHLRPFTLFRFTVLFSCRGYLQLEFPPF